MVYEIVLGATVAFGLVMVGVVIGWWLGYRSAVREAGYTLAEIQARMRERLRPPPS